MSVVSNASTVAALRKGVRGARDELTRTAQPRAKMAEKAPVSCRG